MMKGSKGANQEKDYEVIRVTADSGASDHVAPLTTARHIKLEETEASRSGLCYQSANGERISNLGQRNIKALTNEGEVVAMTWQVADIKRPLASIGRMCDAGNAAIFTKLGGYIIPEGTVRNLINQIEDNGKMLKMNRENGMYNFDLWVDRKQVQESNLNEPARRSTSGF